MNARCFTRPDAFSARAKAAFNCTSTARCPSIESFAVPAPTPSLLTLRSLRASLQERKRIRDLAHVRRRGTAGHARPLRSDRPSADRSDLGDPLQRLRDDAHLIAL